MKNTNITLLILILSGIFRTALGVTNDVVFADSYEKITRGALKVFKDDEDFLMRLQTSDRGLKTQMWLRLLNQIDQMRDFSYDPLNRTNWTYTHLAPPIDTSNPPAILYDSGIPPEAVKEPEIRHAYEEAIRENHQKSLRRNYETRLKNMDEECTFEALKYFNSTYAKTPEDSMALVGSLDVVKDEKHRLELKSKLADYVKLFEKKDK